MRVQRLLTNLLGHRSQNTLMNKRFSMLNQEQVQFFQNCGFLQIDNLVSDEEINVLKQRTREIVDLEKPDGKQTEFQSNASSRDQSFINSGDKIKLFFEPNVFDENNELVVEQHLAYNKMGHAMHDLDPIINKISYQKKFMQILQSLSYKSPSLVQSMYIFKNPKIGQAVFPHTDNTYLMTSPQLSTIAIWVALDDSTLENGCLWGVPGSHLEQTNNFFRVDPDREGTHFHQEKGNKHMGIENAIPFEVQKGGVLIFGGDFVHFSKDNLSQKQRHAYTMHFGEMKGNSWSQHNWLQRPNLPFKDYYAEVRKE